MIRYFLLALAAAVPAAGAPAQPPAVQSPSANDEALLDRFIAALPQAQEALDQTAAVNPELLRHFNALNPGRTDEVRVALEGYSRCAAPAIRAGTIRLLRDIGRSLGPDKVSRLIAFYGGADFAAFRRIGPAAEAGTLTAADRAELDRILAAYPLNDFLAAFQSVGGALDRDQAFTGAITRCAGDLRTAFESRRLRVN